VIVSALAPPTKPGSPPRPAERPRPALTEASWPRLQFAPSKAELSPVSRATLASLAARLEQGTELHVLLEGHTDDSGTTEINRSLSLERAARARAWLLAHGARSSQLAVRGYGSTKPLAPGRSASARAQNRRVEITLEGRGE
jgi:outer membrane protein OmpA-like peptidoglycan-associated protein